METLIRQLTFAESKLDSEKYITYLKNYIKTYKKSDILPGTQARFMDSVILPFQDQLMANRSTPPEVVRSRLHCEGILIAVMTSMS